MSEGLKKYWVDRDNLKVLKYQQGKCFIETEPVQIILAAEVEAVVNTLEKYREAFERFIPVEKWEEANEFVKDDKTARAMVERK